MNNESKNLLKKQLYNSDGLFSLFCYPKRDQSGFLILYHS